MVTTPAVAVGIVWCVAVLWAVSDSDQPPAGTIMSRETFPNLGDCIGALPRYEKLAHERFVSPGPVVCVQVRE